VVRAADHPQRFLLLRGQRLEAATHVIAAALLSVAAATTAMVAVLSAVAAAPTAVAPPHTQGHRRRGQHFVGVGYVRIGHNISPVEENHTHTL